MPYQLGPGSVPLSALLEASAKGYSVCEGTVSVTEPRCVYLVEGRSRVLVGVVRSPAEVSAVISGSRRPSLGGVEEVASLLGVARQTVNTWTKRYPDFPSPLGKVNGRRVWDLSEVLGWNARWRPYGRHLPLPVEATNL